MYQTTYILLAKDKELWGCPRAILDYLETILNPTTCIEIKHQTIANELGVHRPTVTQALNLLVKKGIIIKFKTNSRILSYKLNPNYG